MVAPALPEIAVVPDILADGDAKDGAFEAQDLGLRGRLKIAVLIEDVVGGQQCLAKGSLHATSA